MLKVHLDTDLGGDLDDLCALALLLSWPEIDLVAVTTAAEASGRRAGFVRYALQLAGRNDVPVAAGADATEAMGYRIIPTYPPDELLWPEPVSPASTPLSDALDLMRASIEAGAIIVGIGPFTNLALLDRRYPGLLAHAQLVLMGGYPFPPRAQFPAWGPNMDYNIQANPGSARYVLTHATPLLVPLPVTVETALRRADLASLQQSGPLARLIAYQADWWLDLWPQNALLAQNNPGVPADFINFQHDPLTCAVAGGWDGVTLENLPLIFGLEGTWLIERQDPLGKPLRVVTAVQAEQFHAFWLDIITQ